MNKNNMPLHMHPKMHYAQHKIWLFNKNLLKKTHISFLKY